MNSLSDCFLNWAGGWNSDASTARLSALTTSKTVPLGPAMAHGADGIAFRRKLPGGVLGSAPARCTRSDSRVPLNPPQGHRNCAAGQILHQFETIIRHPCHGPGAPGCQSRRLSHGLILELLARQKPLRL